MSSRNGNITHPVLLCRFQRIIIHTVTNSIVFILLFGSGYAIFVAADNANSTGANNFRLSDLAFDNLLLFFRAFQVRNATKMCICNLPIDMHLMLYTKCL